MKGILERLADGIVLGAEGYLFELERRGYVQAGPFVPEVVLDFPEAVTELHREFLWAGAEVMVAFTYYAHKEKMRTIGREADLEKLNGRRCAWRVQSHGTWASLLSLPKRWGSTILESAAVARHIMCGRWPKV